MSGFDSGRFLSAGLALRTRKVPVPDLAEFFGDGEPEWLVRGLNANELCRSNEAKSRHGLERSLAAALANSVHGEKVAAIQEALGRSGSTEADFARRIEILAAGSVEPECSVEMAVKLGETFPVPFFALTNAILELTGQGSEVEKKPPTSGETPESSPA
jgi:hypothetical protein